MTTMLNRLGGFVRGIKRRALGEAPASRAAAAATRFRVLVAVSGGPNAPAALDVLPGLAKPGNEVLILHVKKPGAPSGAADQTLEEAFARMRGTSSRVAARTVLSPSPRNAIIAATREADLLILGASLGPQPVTDRSLLDLGTCSACPVLVIRAGGDSPSWARRALVVGERSGAGRLGFERALRWAEIASTSQDAILGPSADPFERHAPEWLPRDFSPRVRAVELPDKELDATRVLEALGRGGQDLLVLALDPERLGRSRGWVDDVVARSTRPVVCAFASRKGPRTRRALT
jgi:hypothetical protein